MVAAVLLSVEEYEMHRGARLSYFMVLV